jgi:hypothetical protein
MVMSVIMDEQVLACEVDRVRRADAPECMEVSLNVYSYQQTGVLVWSYLALCGLAYKSQSSLLIGCRPHRP